MRRSPQQILQRFSELRDDPFAGAAYATQVLVGERRAQIIGPALRTFNEFVPKDALPVLRGLYRDLDRDGVKFDAGGDFRAQILRLLRPWLTFDDLELLERAVTTYEYLPPTREEAAATIRAGGLVAMADLDAETARFHAARLLVDVETSRFSGEPARTAASVLAARSEQTLLYLYTWQSNATAEVLAECLRGLTGIPASILRELCTRFSTEAREAAQIGMVDLLTGSVHREVALGELRRRLAQTTVLDVYRYLVITLAASRRKDLVGELLRVAAEERNIERLGALLEALELVGHDAQAAAVTQQVRARLQVR